MKKIVIINLMLLVLVLSMFFFRIIPVPVPDMEGAFGGFHMTSALYELSVSNFVGLGGFVMAFGSMFSLNYYLNKKIKGIKE